MKTKGKSWFLFYLSANVCRDFQPAPRRPSRPRWPWRSRRNTNFAAKMIETSKLKSTLIRLYINCLIKISLTWRGSHLSRFGLELKELFRFFVAFIGFTSSTGESEFIRTASSSTFEADQDDEDDLESLRPLLLFHEEASACGNMKTTARMTMRTGNEAKRTTSERRRPRFCFFLFRGRSRSSSSATRGLLRQANGDRNLKRLRRYRFLFLRPFHIFDTISHFLYSLNSTDKKNVQGFFCSSRVDHEARLSLECVRCFNFVLTRWVRHSCHLEGDERR